MSSELDFCNCRHPDPVVVDDLSTCMACGALLQGKVSDAEATHGMEWLTSDELSNPHHIPAYKHARLDRDKGKKSVRLINLSRVVRRSSTMQYTPRRPCRQPSL
jgi:hypothetical protein